MPPDYVFRSTTPGRRGLTALHLAGLVNDGGAMASLLSERCADALSGWEGARAEDGTLPIDFARLSGLGGLVERFIANKKYEAAVAAGAAQQNDVLPGDGDTGGGAEALPAKSVASQLHRRHGKSGTCDDSASSSRSPSETLSTKPSMEGDDQLAAAKASLKAALNARLAEERAQGVLLRFRNPELEARYQGWHSAGQVCERLCVRVGMQCGRGAAWSEPRTQPYPPCTSMHLPPCFLAITTLTLNPNPQPKRPNWTQPNP